VATTMIGVSALGSTWRRRRRSDRLPRARAPLTNSRSRMESTSARTIRANCTQRVTAITRITLRRLGPSAKTTPMASRMYGMARNTSATRMTTASVRPPWKPARRPSETPIRAESVTADSPTPREIRPPWTMRLKMSRPRWSVPSGCSRSPRASQAGGRRRFMSIWRAGSHGAIWGARTAAPLMMRSTVSPKTARKLGRRRASRAGASRAVTAVALAASLIARAGRRRCVGRGRCR